MRIISESRRSQDAGETRVVDAEAALRDRGLRLTGPRHAVLEVVRGAESHPTAEEVHGLVRRRLPGVSLGTVYRNLRLLVGAGLLKELPGPYAASTPTPARIITSCVSAAEGSSTSTRRWPRRTRAPCRRAWLPHRVLDHASPHRALRPLPKVPETIAGDPWAAPPAGGARERQDRLRVSRLGGSAVTDELFFEESSGSSRGCRSAVATGPCGCRSSRETASSARSRCRGGPPLRKAHRRRACRPFRVSRRHSATTGGGVVVALPGGGELVAAP